MQGPRLSIRSLMIGIAFLALLLTVVGEAVLIQKAAIREQQFLAELYRQRAMAEDREAQAVDALKSFHDAIANAPERQNSPADSDLKPR